MASRCVIHIYSSFNEIFPPSVYIVIIRVELHGIFFSGLVNALSYQFNIMLVSIHGGLCIAMILFPSCFFVIMAIKMVCMCMYVKVCVGMRNVIEKQYLRNEPEDLKCCMWTDRIEQTQLILTVPIVFGKVKGQ